MQTETFDYETRKPFKVRINVCDVSKHAYKAKMTVSGPMPDGVAPMPKPVAVALPVVPSVAMVIDAYKQSQWFAGLAPTTKRSYSSILDKLTTHMGAYPLKDVNAEVFSTCIEGSANTVNYTRTVLQAMVSWYNETYKQNVAHFQFRAKGHKVKPSPALTVDQYHILTQARDSKKGTHSLVLNFVCFEFLSGLRGNEAFNIKLDRDIVELKGRKFIQVRYAKGKVKGEVDRYVPLSPQIQECLDYPKKVRPFAKPVALLDGICLSHARDLWRELRKELGIEAKMHGARSGFANQAFEQGVPVEQIQWILGHSSPKQTLSYVRPTALQKAQGFDGLKITP